MQVERARRLDWWLTTGQIREGGDRIHGPYASREHAEADRTARGKPELDVDSTPKGLYPPLPDLDRYP